MKKIYFLLLLLSICFQSWAQIGGLFNSGTYGRMPSSMFSDTPEEYVQAYYYGELNIVKIRRVLLCRRHNLDGGGMASIRVCEDDDVYIDADGEFHINGGYTVSNIARCNKKEPANELEQRFMYKYIDKGIWYYFNTGLDLFLAPEKKSFKEKFKELLFK